MHSLRLKSAWLVTLLLVAFGLARPTAITADKHVPTSGGASTPATGRTQHLNGAEDIPEGLSKGDWSGIRQAYEAGRRRVFERAPGTWTARNPDQQLTAEFDGRGARLVTDGGTGFGLKLAGYGFSDKTNAVAARAKRVTTRENRIEYTWDDRLTEWFVNDGKGLEQGWTLASGLEGATTVRLDVAVTGGLRAKTVDASTVALTERSGAAALTYGGLKAWDATGKTLPAKFEVADNRIGVTVETAGAVYPVTVDPWLQQAYLKASNTDVFDQFGRSVAVSGDTVVVGARGEASAATGIDGNQADNSAIQAGAAYVFVRNGITWSQQAYLKASNTGASDFFGYSVAVSGDTVVIGAYGEDSAATGVNGNQADNSASFAGAAYVFVRNGTTWSQQAYLKASNTDVFDFFGLSVAVSGDTVVVGAPGESSNATGVDGNQANSTLSSGAAYVFVRSGTTWSQQAYLKASNTDLNDNFGNSVAVSGDTVVVGAPLEASNATGVNGNQADNSAFQAGAAYVFVRSGTTWSQQAYLKASNTDANDQFSISVAVSGDTVVVGTWREASNATGVNGNQADNSALDSGAAYVFVRSGTTWSQQAYLKASNTNAGDRFGNSVAVSGDTVVVGASEEASNATGVNGNQADNSAFQAGAAYIFVRRGTTWSQQAYLKASNTGGGDGFGSSVAVAGNTVVVGAVGEASAATGVNGNQADNLAPGSGAAYVFSLNLTELPRLYVADTDNSRIQVFDGNTWTLAPRSAGVVGSAAGQFRSPEGVTATPTNQIYVADTGNNRIHWYNGFTWSDFAAPGSALNQVRAPQAVAVDVTGQFLFVADTGNNRILRFAANAPGSAGVVLANPGFFPGQVNNPRGLAVDNLGNLFVADTGNSRILRIGNATTVTTADTGAIVTTGLRVPEGVALDDDGNLYIADTGNSRILQLSGGGTPTILAVLGTALGSVRSPEGVTVTNFASGPLAGRQLVVGDTLNSRIQARPLAGGTWSLVGGMGSALGQFRSPSKIR